MKGRATLVAVALLAIGCVGSPSNVASRGASPQASTGAPSSPSPPAVTSPSDSPSPSPAASPSPFPTPSAPSASVDCAGGTAGTSTVLVGEGGLFGDEAIYDVTNPLAPKLVCRIQSTTAHLSSATGFEYLDPRSPSETDVAVHTYGVAGETLAGKLPASADSAAWLPAGGVGAYTVRLDSAPGCPSSAEQVWTNLAGTTRPLYAYCMGIGDCICRFGLPGPVLSVSPDGKYLVSGWLSGKGSEPMAVYRLSDHARVWTLPSDVSRAFWDRTADRLFMVALTGGVQAWSPDGTTNAVGSTSGWGYFANQSPDGRDIVFTDWSLPDGTQPRVYLFSVATGTTRMLIDQPRSQAVFVKNDWIWYLEERSCAECPNGTEPTGKVYAMDLTTGVEQQVTFAVGENVPALDWRILTPGEFWPNS